MALTDEEKETVLRWDKASTQAVIFTHDVPIISKLKNAGVEPVREGKYEGTPWAEFVLDKKWIKVGKPRRRDDLKGKGVRKRGDE